MARNISSSIRPVSYTHLDVYKRQDKEYQAVFLENEYIKVMILPELGGRIQRAYDKTNDYDFVSVSYTHLDVYKRQAVVRLRNGD